MNLVIRADAGPKIGGGHVMRSRALGEALVRRGWDAAFASRAETVEHVARLAGEIPVIPLDSPARDEAGALEAAVPGGCDALLIDHYERGADFERDCAGWAGKRIVIEDFPDRDHDCELLVDPTAGRESAAYAGRVPASAQYLIGPMYAPLRAQFARKRWDSPDEPIKESGPFKVFVALGATDPANVTSAVLHALDGIELPLEIDVVLSGAAPNRAKVERLASKQRHNAQLHLDVADMAGLMAGADLAIGAGGSGAWERCCLGVPTVALKIAENQRDVVTGLEKSGAAVVLRDPMQLRETVAAMLADPDRRNDMSRAARRLCDGLGAERIALAVGAAVKARDGKPVTLRPVDDEDVLTLLDWQRDPETRRFARDSRVPKESEHRAWFARKRADPGCIFHVLEHAGDPAGYVRLDRDRERGGFEVSIATAPGKRRLGIAGAGLALIRNLLPEARLLAFVKPENETSVNLFAAAGYRPLGAGWYVHEPADQ